MEILMFIFLGVVTITMSIGILPSITNQGKSFMLDTRINSILNLITDIDKRNPQHSLGFYAQNLDALQAIENKLNIENNKNNFLIHLSKMESNADGIHVSVENILPEKKAYN